MPRVVTVACLARLVQRGGQVVRDNSRTGCSKPLPGWPVIHNRAVVTHFASLHEVYESPPYCADLPASPTSQASRRTDGETR
jgi:hypothetical protein